MLVQRAGSAAARAMTRRATTALVTSTLRRPFVSSSSRHTLPPVTKSLVQRSLVSNYEMPTKATVNIGEVSRVASSTVNEEVLYEGPLGKTFKLLKLFSLSSLGLSTALSPFIFILPAELPMTGRVFLAGVAMTTTTFSTYLISLFTTPYVTRITRRDLPTTTCSTNETASDASPNADIIASDVTRPSTPAQSLYTLETSDILTRPIRTTILPGVSSADLLRPSDRPLTSFEMIPGSEVGPDVPEGQVAFMEGSDGKVSGVWTVEGGRLLGHGKAAKTRYFLIPNSAKRQESGKRSYSTSTRSCSSRHVSSISISGSTASHSKTNLSRSTTTSQKSRNIFTAALAGTSLLGAALLPRLTARSTKNYEGHVPVNALENSFLAVGSGVAGIADVKRGDLIALLSETASRDFIPFLTAFLTSDREGRQILRDRPLLSSSTVDLGHLRTLKRGTLGREWVEWLDEGGLTPDTRGEVTHIDSPVHAYSMTRYRQTHDLYHTLFSLPPTLPYELTLKVIELANMGQPVALLSSLLGPFRLPAHAITGSERDRAHWVPDWVPYALRQGSRARKQFVGIYWEKRWEQGLGDLRKEFGVSRMEDPIVMRRWKAYGKIRESERELRRKGEWIDEPEQW